MYLKKNTALLYNDGSPDWKIILQKKIDKIKWYSKRYLRFTNTVISIYNQLGHTEPPQPLTVGPRTLMKAFQNSSSVFFIEDRSLSKQLEYLCSLHKASESSTTKITGMLISCI